MELYEELEVIADGLFKLTDKLDREQTREAALKICIEQKLSTRAYVIADDILIKAWEYNGTYLPNHYWTYGPSQNITVAAMRLRKGA